MIELLEKRVKSRFSHRQLHLFNSLKFDEYKSLFKILLKLADQFPDKLFAKEWNESIEVCSCFVNWPFLHTKIGISTVFTYMRKFYLTYPIPTHGKDKKCTVACQAIDRQVMSLFC